MKLTERQKMAGWEPVGSIPPESIKAWDEYGDWKYLCYRLPDIEGDNGTFFDTEPWGIENLCPRYSVIGMRAVTRDTFDYVPQWAELAGLKRFEWKEHNPCQRLRTFHLDRYEFSWSKVKARWKKGLNVSRWILSHDGILLFEDVEEFIAARIAAEVAIGVHQLGEL